MFYVCVFLKAPLQSFNFSKTYPTCFCFCWYHSSQRWWLSLLVETSQLFFTSLQRNLCESRKKESKCVVTSCRIILVLYQSKTEKQMFIYIKTLFDLMFMLSGLLLPNAVKWQHNFSNLWFNGAVCSELESRRTQDAGLRWSHGALTPPLHHLPVQTHLPCLPLGRRKIIRYFKWVSNMFSKSTKRLSLLHTDKCLYLNQC